MSLTFCTSACLGVYCTYYIDACANSIAGYRAWLIGYLLLVAWGLISLTLMWVLTPLGIGDLTHPYTFIPMMYCLSVLHTSSRLACSSISMSCDISMEVLHLYWCIATMLYALTWLCLMLPNYHMLYVILISWCHVHMSYSYVAL